MATNAELKTLTATQIRDKTSQRSITKTNVADRIDAAYDYTDQQVSFKIYKAKLSQSGTNNITAVVLKNDTGFTFTFTRNSVGNYSINFSSIMSDISKVDIYLHFCQSSFAVPIYEIDNLSVLATLVTKYWNGSNFAFTDDVLNNATLYIVINN